MCVVILHQSQAKAWIVNAGHMPPILRSGNGKLSEPSEHESGLPLGIVEDISTKSFQTKSLLVNRSCTRWDF